MSWPQTASELLFPSVGRETDPEFRGTLRRILHRGFWITGGLGIFAVTAYVLGKVYGAGLPLRWAHGAEPAGGSVVLADKVVIGAVCGTLIAAAAFRCSLQGGRMLAAIGTAVAAGASLYGDLARGALSPGYVTLFYMLAVGAVPYRPRQALGLGAALTVLLYGMGTYGPQLLMGEPSLLEGGHLVRLGTVSVLLTGISAVLHLSRYRQHRARKEAETLRDEVAELEEAKSQFFANLSHELRTPVTLLLGPLEDALEGRYGDLPGSLAERLGAMKTQAHRLEDLIGQLLRLSKLDEGRMELEARPVDLGPFLQRMKGLFRSRADREDVTVRVETSGAPSVCADPEALRQIVSNLLANALEHAPEGSAVRLGAWPREKDAGDESKERVAISVRDDGPGLPEEVQEEIFGRYVGAAGEPGDPIDTSTGIGLAVVKELAERHGGTVAAESEQGFGTDITAVLPAHCSSLPEEDRAAGEAPAPEMDPQPEVRHVVKTDRDAPSFETGVEEANGETPSGERSTVLVVDDEAGVRAYLKEVLAPRYRAVTAENGREALQMAREDAPDLVISDVMMPEMDGFELCRALREDEALQAVPIILLTVQKGEESRMKGLRRGADAYLGKPFRPAELRQRAENLIEVRRYLRAQEHDSPSQQEQTEGQRGAEASPDVRNQQRATGAESEFLQGVRAVVEEHLGNSGFGVEWLADEMDLSARQLQRRLQDEAGLSVGAFIRAVRLERAAVLLESGEVRTVKEAAQATGYRDPSHFSRLFKEAHGRSPSTYKS